LTCSLGIILDSSLIVSFNVLAHANPDADIASESCLLNHALLLSQPTKLDATNRLDLFASYLLVGGLATDYLSDQNDWYNMDNAKVRAATKGPWSLLW
jgi:hypothetical protein